MRILLDECVHAGIRHIFTGHSVQTVPQAGWSGIKNGKLLALIAGNFEVILTIDQNIRHQQNLSDLSFAIVLVAVADDTLPSYQPLFGLMQATVERAVVGEVLSIP